MKRLYFLNFSIFTLILLTCSSCGLVTGVFRLGLIIGIIVILLIVALVTLFIKETVLEK